MKSFSYRFRNTKEDFFLFNMSNIYSQWTAIVNIIFTVAMMIQVRNHKQQINWDDFNGVIKRPGTLIVMPDGKHAYILTGRVVHDEMNDLYEFIKEACCGKKN